MLGFIPAQVQDLALPFVELHEVLSAILHLAQVPLKADTTIWYISYSSLCCIICELAEDTFCPIVQVINDEVEQYWASSEPWGTAAVTCIQLDLVPLITWETLSIALVKSR